MAETTLPGLTRRSSFVGASLTMIDRHYGHLACDGRQHAVAVLDGLAASEPASAAWTFGGRRERPSGALS